MIFVIVSRETVVGDVKGKTAILLDDLISSGTTMATEAAAFNRLRTTDVYAVAMHGWSLKKPIKHLRKKLLGKFWLTILSNRGGWMMRWQKKS